MRRVTAHELLSDVEEHTLGQAIEAGLLAAEALDTGEIPVPAETGELAALVAAGRAAWGQFLLANIRLVMMIAAREAKRSRLELDELFQEGFVALAESLRRYDYRIGRFATYAFPRVRQRVLLVASSRLGALPTSLALQRVRVLGLSSSLEQELGADDVWDQACTELGLDPNLLWQLLANSVPQSLTEIEDGGHNIAAQLTDFDAGLEREALHRCVELLAPLEREVISLRFGLNGSPALPLTAVAKRLGRSASGIRRIEQRGLDDLRYQLQEREEGYPMSA